jgi:hypothetical protein
MAEPQKPAVTLNRRLNLVVKVDGGRDPLRGTLHVFAVPVARSVFDANFMIMCRAYAEIYRNSLGVIAGPKAAALLIKQEADVLGESAKGDMLLEEIRRLTNVLVPSVNGAGGYTMVDYGVAIRQGLIGEDDVADIEAAICFFTLASRVGPHFQLDAILEGLSLFWRAQTTSLTLTEYMRSLPTSTTGDAIGPSAAETETVQASAATLPAPMPPVSSASRPSIAAPGPVIPQ